MRIEKPTRGLFMGEPIGRAFRPAMREISGFVKSAFLVHDANGGCCSPHWVEGLRRTSFRDSARPLGSSASLFQSTSLFFSGIWRRNPKGPYISSNESNRGAKSMISLAEAFSALPRF